MAAPTNGTDSVTFDSPPDRRNRPAILVVDDEPLMGDRLEHLCTKSPDLSECLVMKATSLEEARTVLAQESIQVMTLDKNLGEDQADGTKINGIDAIPEFLGLKPDLQIIMHTGSDDVADVVSAMTKGAADYIPKNTDDAIIQMQLVKAIQRAKIAQTRTRLQKTEDLRSTNGAAIFDFGFKSDVMQRLLHKLEAVSESNRPVLLLGESGAGKTTIARAIHEYRKKYLKQEEREFFAVNLTALAPTLVESELFGHEKGSFTGATERRVGFVELANNGTLFIDEIGDIDLSMQAKLITVLDKGEFHRVGGKHQLKSNFKLVCATNKDLEQMVKDGKFREDFLARISTFPIEVPSLRDRREDIPDLVRTILPQVAKEARFAVTYDEIPSDFIDALVKNPPRLNIRGLEILLHQLLTLTPKDQKGKKRLDRWRSVPEFFELTSRRVSKNPTLNQRIFDPRTELIDEDFTSLPQLMECIEERAILEAKKKAGTNKQAAKLLRISEGTMSLKLRGINSRHIGKEGSLS
jgi:DNA-binding NtrC family response regulator